MGTKGKKPAMLFYPRDWLADPALNVCSLCAQGLWLRMICYMWESEKRGYLMVNGKALHPDQICRLVGAGNRADEVLHWLDELKDAGVYSVTEDGIIYNRRMVDDQALPSNKGTEIKDSSPRARTRVEDEYNIRSFKTKAQVAEALRVKRIYYSSFPAFEKFWEEYPARNGVRANKQEAAVSWIFHNLESESQGILKAVLALKHTDQWKKEDGKFVPMAVTFLNNRRWEDEVEPYEPKAWSATEEWA
tara:strand:- start:2717 stop:3457 length:741 start_codon:yes stop_codon:yes gene_type:complete